MLSKAKEFAIDVTEGYPMEMHKVLVAWFMWGFTAKVVLIGLGLLIALYSVATGGGRASYICGSITCALYVTNSLIWLGFGAIWRFSNAGQIASGDKLERLYGKSDDEWDKDIKAAVKTNGYQVSSGQFMKIYLMVMLWVVVIAFVALLVTALTVCCCDTKDFKKQWWGSPADDRAREREEDRAEDSEHLVSH